MSTDVTVVGGGAAGMMAAFFAAEQGASVKLLEKNRQLGKKLRITGKGRCNLTNNCDQRQFFENIPGDGRFLHSAFSAFSPQSVMAFFEANGIALKTERGRRVFPVSDNANDVADLLRDLCRRRGVNVIHGTAQGISVRDRRMNGVKTETGLIPCTACVIATGGISYPLTGSTGDGYRFARSLGHTVTALRPSLVPLMCGEACCGRLQGLSLKNVKLRIYGNGKLLSEEMGEMLFTHYGISGPLVLSASARMRVWDDIRYRAEIDLKPALDHETLDRRILRDLKSYQNRSLSNALVDLLPHSMIPEVLSVADAPEDIQANSVTREIRHRLVQALKAFPLTVTGLRPAEEAIITSGGVSLKEVNPRSMESRLISGLYFAGEVLDLDAYTGGYNLQIAWMTGRLAGISAGQKQSTPETDDQG